MAKENLAILLFVLFMPLLNFIVHNSLHYLVIFITIFIIYVFILRSNKEVLLLLIILTYLIGSITYLNTPYEVDFEDTSFMGTITNQTNNSFDIKVNLVEDSLIIRPFIIRVYDDSNDFALGSKLLFNAKLSVPREARNPGQFSHREYLNSMGIKAISYDIEVVSVIDRFSFRKLINYTREKLLKKLDVLTKERAAIMRSMLLGDRSRLAERRDIYTRAGVGHVLVVSGLHLAIILLFVKKVLNGFNASQKVKILVELATVWSYAIVAGLGFSVLRASLMLTIYLLSETIKISKLNRLFLVLIIILSFNPTALKHIGLQLSFLATIGVLFVSKHITAMFPANKLGKAMGVILAVQVTTMPLILSAFNSYNISSIIANLLIIPLTVPVLILGIMLFIPGISLLAMPMLSIFLDVHFGLANLFANQLAFVFNLKTLSIVSLLFYLALVLGLIYFLQKNQRAKAIIAIALIIVIIIINNHTNYTKIVFFDVGHGDAAFIHTQCNYKLLIDAGDRYPGFDAGNDIILPYLRLNGVNEIDSIVISHAHRDHVGGLISLLKHIKVKRIYVTEQAFFRSMLEMDEIRFLSEEKNIEIIFLYAGETKVLAKSLIVETLHPAYGRYEEDSNDNSLVIRLTINDLRVLFTGDIEREGEDELVSRFPHRLAADILKVPHHGSRTSSTQELLDLVKPSIAINSSSYNKFRNLPANEVILRYNSNGIEMFRTDVHGAIIIRYKSNKLYIKKYVLDEEVKFCQLQQWAYCAN